MDDRKLAEFNYKIINNILINKAYLSKWISETNAKYYSFTGSPLFFVFRIKDFFKDLFFKL